MGWESVRYIAEVKQMGSVSVEKAEGRDSTGRQWLRCITLEGTYKHTQTPHQSETNLKKILVSKVNRFTLGYRWAGGFL